MDGQINMFDFWSRLTPQEEGKEVQMVSLMPEGAAEEPPEAEEVQPTQAVQRDSSVTEQNTAAEEPQTEASQVESVVAEQQTEVVPEQEARADASQEAEASEDTPPADRTVTDKSQAPVMHRESRSADGTILAEISYYNYNRICVKRQNEEPIWKNFDNAKDAVDFYIEEMMKL
jgi:hypothetical protein